MLLRKPLHGFQGCGEVQDDSWLSKDEVASRMLFFSDGIEKSELGAGERGI